MPQLFNVDTIIYVDVDGVVNIGIADGDNLPLLLTKRDVRSALRALPNIASVSAEQHAAIQSLVAVGERLVGQGEEHDDTYLKFCAGDDGSSLSDILVHRLASIIDLAHQNSGSVHVVLASKWRKPQQLHRRKCLEEKISQSLGKSFEFDSTTALVTELNAADRIETIGDHLALCCAKSPNMGRARKLQVLVLDDFFITALGRWECGGSKMSSCSKVESYLKSKADRPNVVVKLAHCYDEWKSSTAGRMVQVGSGLTALLTQEAKAFLSPLRDPDDPDGLPRHVSGSDFSGSDDELLTPERRGRMVSKQVNGFGRQRSEGDDDLLAELPPLAKGQSIIVHL
eukprot:TRINITY_DN32856_c0_g1_i1.p1 TRINITY_DN32856_c0_g1~~TRINITY_DN32856_c0_g1_i1.p1  ORF type:complete len:341 (-),score=57.83 TRINITY_DN32856_c0_g1_i1:245-1267(-)